MSGILEIKRPYEISVWRDILKTVPGATTSNIEDFYFEEEKIAIIGSDTMTGLNRVFSPVLKLNTNGERTLTFSLKYRYFDEMVGDFVDNPFKDLLINERKIKLKYDGQWYDFVIKERVESSEEYTYEFTASDAFIQELSKNGYNITLDSELNNNQGTITELAEKVLENTDWQVDKENSDLLQQTVSEPLYLCTVNNSFSALNLDTKGSVTIAAGTNIYIFYNYINAKIANYVQFIILNDPSDEDWYLDDNNAIHSTNYRFLGTAEYTEDEYGKVTSIKFKDENAEATISVGPVNTQSQGYRLVYNPKVTYDPVMKRTVNILEAETEDGTQEIYSYKDYDYSTTAAIVSYVVNGSNFIINDMSSDDDSVTRATGWNNLCQHDQNHLLSAQITTRPKIEVNNIVGLKDLKKINSYLELEFPAKQNLQGNAKFLNAFYNEGFLYNASIIDHIAAGEKYVFRIRYGWSTTEGGNPVDWPDPYRQQNPTFPEINAIVAKYKENTDSLGNAVKVIDSGNIYFDFNLSNSYIQKNNTIYGGEMRGGDAQNSEYEIYVIDGVVQEPSLKYAYDFEGTKYVWHPDKERYVLGSRSPSSGGYAFMPYFHTVAQALKPISNTTLLDSEEKIGLFLYGTNTTKKYMFIEDVAVFKYVRDPFFENEDIPVFPGNAPLAEATEKEFFYKKPEEGMVEDEIDQYNSVEVVAEELGTTKDKIKYLRNEDCEKYLSVKVEHSNYFNILQTLCETFECWVRFEVEHEDDGRIKIDTSSKPYKPIKKIVFKEFIGKPNSAGFKYGINLNSIQRTLDSSEFVTKLIVGSSANEYMNSGNLTIADANSNVLGESFILNFDYYLNQGLVDRVSFNKDFLELGELIKNKNQTLKLKNEQYRLATRDLVKIGSQRSVFSEYLDAAKKEVAEGKEDYQKATKKTYGEPLDTSTLPEDKNEKIIEILYRIYTSSAVTNNYGGIVTSVKQEYERLNLLCNGAETYTFSIRLSNTSTDNPTTKLVMSHYFEGFKCSFKRRQDSGEALEIFESGINTKTFTSGTLYDTVVINNIPSGYSLEYFNGVTRVTTDTVKDLEIVLFNTTSRDLTRRFKLIPSDTLQEQNVGLKNQIKQLEEEKQRALNIFHSKYSKFIQEGTWESSDYIDAERYYLDAVQVSNTSAQPKVTYTINVAEISELDEFTSYKFDVGDKTYVEDTEFFGWTEIDGVKTPVKQEVIVSEVEWHLDEPAENVITVQNYKTQFEDLFNRISAAVQTLQFHEAMYTRLSSIFTEDGQIISDALLAALEELSGQGYGLAGDNVRVTKDGILINDSANTQNYLLIKGSGIDRSTDSGMNWENILSAKGININALRAGMIDTDRVTIMSGSDPAFKWDKSGLSAYGYSEDGSFDLSTFVRFDKYGVYGIKKGADYVVSSLEDVQDKAYFGLTWDGFFIKNDYADGYVSITTDNDFQIMRKVDEEYSHYEPTEDEEIVEGKQYYTLTIETEYIPTVVEEDYELVGLYEYDDEIEKYVLTTDEEIVQGKQYYIKFDREVYELKESPVAAELPIYYELITEHVIQDVEKIKIGALDFDENNNPTKYGIKIRNNLNEDVFTTGDDGNITITGTINASAGRIGGMTVDNDKLTMETIVLEPGNGIYSRRAILIDEEPVYEWVWDESSQSYIQVDTGERVSVYEPIFKISDVDGSALFNSARIRGEINAGSGNFYGLVTVGKQDDKPDKPYIEIDGNNSWIKTSNYGDGATYGWMINKDGDAVFNNITARGAIKTTVFEYAEIQAVGGIFLFRPSSTIKSGRLAAVYELTEDVEIVEGKTYYTYDEENEEYVEVEEPTVEDIENYYEKTGEDLVLNIEKPLLFAKFHYFLSEDTSVQEGKAYYEKINIGYELVKNPSGNPSEKYYERETTNRGGWCKISNYTSDGSEPEVSDILSTNGLSHVYEATYIDFDNKEITLKDGVAFVNAISEATGKSADMVLSELEGGALIDMGQEDGSSNYGIGVNSSDNTVNLPARAISLFETIIDDTQPTKVTYDYKGIFGTLPVLSSNTVSQLYTDNMVGTQGVFTNNIYIGDANSYLAFHDDKSSQITPTPKKLTIKGADIRFLYNDQEQSLEEVLDTIEVGEGFTLVITSSSGPVFTDSIDTTLTAKLYKDGVLQDTIEKINALGYQINWYIGNSATPVQGTGENKITYRVTSSDDYIDITAKLEDLAN